MNDFDFMPPRAVGALPVLLFCGVVLGLGGALAIAFMIRRIVQLTAARVAQDALLATARRAPLAEGKGRAIQGRVEVDGEGDVAVRVEIQQRVKDQGRHHTWREEHRRIAAAPFHLVQPDGTAVRVEPPEDVLVADLLETSLPADMPNRRVRTAEVRRGAILYACGTLERGPDPRVADGYRDGIGWRLVAPGGDARMLLASAVIQDRYVERIRVLRIGAVVAAVVYLVFHALVTLPLLVAELAGEAQRAVVTSTRTFETRTRRVETHYVVAARADDGTVVSGEVGRETFDWIRAEPSDPPPRVPILRVHSSLSPDYLGTEPSTRSGNRIIGLMLALCVALVVVSEYRTRTPWYDRRRLSERGQGPWEETRVAARLP